MADVTLLGNAPLMQRLHAALERDRIPHALLITGPAGSGKHTLARWLCAALQCTGGSHPCLRCVQCRKVLDQTHPDVIVVDDPDRTSLPVKLVRDACSSLSVRPNEGNKKIYLFPHAQKLNAQGQNALLKCMEEPPAYGVFVLLAENPEQLLPTVRSRCAELRMSPLTHEILVRTLSERFPEQTPQSLAAAARRSEGYLGRAETLLREGDALLPQSQKFLAAYLSDSPGELLRLLVPMEKLKRDALRPILLQWRELLYTALTFKSAGIAPWPECAQIAQRRSDGTLLSAIDALSDAVARLDANVSPAHLCGALSILLQ